MLVDVAGEPWREQISYYRRRAAEYDVTSYGDLGSADGRIAALTDRLQPTGDVLEIACGTGIWTRHLLTHARAVTAIDAAPEMIARARQRVPAQSVTFCVADVLDWIPPQHFDTVFFAFWLSHVPAAAFGRFWSVVRGALANEGRVLFVDDQPVAADRETYVAGSGEVVERCLSDGTRHRLIKVARDPGELTRLFTGLGWQAAIWPSDPDWLLGEARPAV
jgi:SAM-dependent methyltransferase